MSYQVSWKEMLHRGRKNLITAGLYYKSMSIAADPMDWMVSMMQVTDFFNNCKINYCIPKKKYNSVWIDKKDFSKAKKKSKSTHYRIANMTILKKAIYQTSWKNLLKQSHYNKLIKVVWYCNDYDYDIGGIKTQEEIIDFLDKSKINYCVPHSQKDFVWVTKQDFQKAEKIPTFSKYYGVMQV